VFVFCSSSSVAGDASGEMGLTSKQHVDSSSSPASPFSSMDKSSRLVTMMCKDDESSLLVGVEAMAAEEEDEKQCMVNHIKSERNFCQSVPVLQFGDINVRSISKNGIDKKVGH
jgi:hypothetical protein